MNLLQISNLDLKLTLFSGQTFAWEMINEYFVGAMVNRVVVIKQEGESIYWQTYPEKNDFEFIKNYFNLDKDYDLAIQKIQIDQQTIAAIKKYPGLRVLNQDFHQTLFSFLLAQNKNIKAIRQSLNILRKLYGHLVEIQLADSKIQVLTFPSLEFFHQITLEQLSDAKVGYRAKYIKHAAEILSDQKFPDFSHLKVLSPLLLRRGQGSVFLDEHQTRSQLLQIHGIGNKVADCIMTFSLGFDNITPIDVWGDRIVRDLYKNYKSKSYEQKRKWFTKKFGGNTDLAGQFLFEYIRNYNPEDYINIK